MRTHLRVSLILLFAAILSGLPGALASPDLCRENYAALTGARSVASSTATAPAEAKFVPYKALVGRPETEVRQFFRAVSGRQSKLKATAQRLANTSLKDVERYYLEIKKQVGKEGYVRALSVEEAANIFVGGKMGAGYDFAFRNDGARVGHGGNFIFLLCRKCPPSMFTDGALGSSVVNQVPIPLEELELVVPQVPPWAAQ